VKKHSLSIHKSFLNKQTSVSVKLKKTFKLTNPGHSPTVVTSPVLRQNTDRGKQLLSLSYYKKCLKATKITNNRLDLVLFYLKFSKSLSESKHLIAQRLVKVNNVIVTNIYYVLNEFSIIECDNKNSFANYVTHEISNTIIIPKNIVRINESKGVYYNNTESKSILLPKEINLGLMRRMNKT
jgi:ribosomal protein S4